MLILAWMDRCCTSVSFMEADTTRALQAALRPTYLPPNGYRLDGIAKVSLTRPTSRIAN
jgi:hypothetical protein